MKPINYKSDFDVILHLQTCVHNDDGTVERKDVGFPDHDFVATFWTASKVNTFVASCINGVMTNCFNDNGQIHVVFDNHRLSKGRLMVELHTLLPNGIYADGIQDIYEPHPLDIELVDDAGECPSRIEVETSVAVVYRSVYEDAVNAGYEGSQQDYYQLLSQLPDSVQVASSLRQSVEDISNLVTDGTDMIASLNQTIEDANNLVDNAKGKVKVINTLNEHAPEIPTDASYDDMVRSVDFIGFFSDMFTKIGYEGEIDCYALLQDIEKSYIAKIAYENGEITNLSNCGVFAPKVAIKGNANKLFMNNKVLVYTPELDLSSVTDASYMFGSCYALVSIPELDLSSVTNASYMFNWCSALVSIPELDLSSVTDASYMFSSCSALVSIPELDLSSVTNTRGMFYNCKALVSIPELDLSSVTDASNMFGSCKALVSIPELDLSSVTNTSEMFNGCSALVSIPELDLSSVTNTRLMFNYCTALVSIPELDLSSVTDAYSMFNGCYALVSIPELDLSSVTNASGMFNGCGKIVRFPKLVLGKVTSNSNMFYNCTALQYLYMENMGEGAAGWSFAKSSLWGSTDESRQSVIYTLLTHSYDRAANGLSAGKITLHANTKAVLTEEEIAAITAKGYTIA